MREGYSPRDYAQVVSQMQEWCRLAGVRLRRINELEEEIEKLREALGQPVDKD